MFKHRTQPGSVRHGVWLDAKEAGGSVWGVGLSCCMIPQQQDIPSTSTACMADRLAPSSRHKFVHEGRTIYEWDQSFSEVNIYVDIPPGAKAKDLFCNITNTHVSLGLAGNPPYLDHDLPNAAKVSESFWTLEDSTLHLTLTKAQEGEPWPSAFLGHSLDALAKQKEQERLMLERFQLEHPGFDFSGATFTGQAPNPRTFMGGKKSS